MEKLTQESDISLPAQSGTHILTTAIAGLILSGCMTTIPVSDILYRVTPRPISKLPSHQGPFGDTMCTTTFDNGSKILQLCQPKPPIYGRTQQLTIPKNTLPQTRIVPPVYSYRMNPLTRKLEQYIFVPQRFETVPGYTTIVTQYCNEVTQFSQINGVKLSTQVICH